MNEDRAERVSASLEEQFHACRQQADTYLARLREGTWLSYSVVDLVKIVRVNAQLAQVITRIESAKNRKSNPQ